MRKIKIGFSTGRTLFSKAIRFFDQSPFSHVYITWTSESIGRDIIYQASNTSVNFVGKERFDKTSITLATIEMQVTDETFKKCIQFCIDNVGVPYGWKQIFGMAYIRIMKFFGKKVKNPFRDGRTSYVCSELVGTLLKESTEIDITLDLEVAGPKELYEYLKLKGF